MFLKMGLVSGIHVIKKWMACMSHFLLSYSKECLLSSIEEGLKQKTFYLAFCLHTSSMMSRNKVVTIPVKHL